MADKYAVFLSHFEEVSERVAKKNKVTTADEVVTEMFSDK